MDGIGSETPTREVDTLLNPNRSSDAAGTASEPPRGAARPKPWFFQEIDWRTAARYAAILGLLASFSHCLSDRNLQQSQAWPWAEFLRLFCLYAPCAFMGAVFSLKTGFQPFLMNRPSAWLGKGRQVVIFGVLPGAAIGLTFYRMFAPFRFSPRIPLYLREMDSFYDSFVLSLRAAVTEELVFRFFLLAAFYYILTRVFQPLADRGWARLGWLAVLGSILLSAWLFGLVHGSFGFTTAFLGGMLFGAVFWRAGFESAALSHFVADFLFFNLTYVGG